MKDWCYILHQRPYREHSVLATLLTASDGVCPAVAHGVRAPKPTMRLVEFNRFSCELRGNNDLKTLAELEPVEPLLMLQGLPLYLGMYLNELCTVLLPPGLAMPRLFLGYFDALQVMSQHEVSWLELERALRLFEHQLLQHCSHEQFYAIEVDRGEPVTRDGFYQLSGEEGFVRATVGYRGASLLALHEDRLDDEQERQIARLVFRQWLQARLPGRVWKSREMLQQLWPMLRGTQS